MGLTRQLAFSTGSVFTNVKPNITQYVVYSETAEYCCLKLAQILGTLKRPYLAVAPF